MNIFINDPDPSVAVQMWADQHVNKILTEAVQIYSTGMHALDPGSARKPPMLPTHFGHPWCKFASRCIRDASGLNLPLAFLACWIEHIAAEWYVRFRKQHGSYLKWRDYTAPDGPQSKEAAHLNGVINDWERIWHGVKSEIPVCVMERARAPDAYISYTRHLVLKYWLEPSKWTWAYRTSPLEGSGWKASLRHMLAAVEV